MPTFTGVLSNAVEKLLFHPMTVTSTERIEDRFCVAHIQGKSLLGVKQVSGQAVQFFLGNLTKRAYTPMNLDPATGSASFLFYLHGGGPGSAWAAKVKAGDTCQVMRPKDSLDFTNFSRPALFFGDETSFAAAQALHACGRDPVNNRYVLEVNSPAQAEIMLARLGVGNTILVQKAEDGSHLAAVASALMHHASAMHAPQWIFTGQARSIQKLQGSLKMAGVQISKSKVRAYWSPGKTGMD